MKLTLTKSYLFFFFSLIQLNVLCAQTCIAIHQQETVSFRSFISGEAFELTVCDPKTKYESSIEYNDKIYKGSEKALSNYFCGLYMFDHSSIGAHHDLTSSSMKIDQTRAILSKSKSSFFGKYVSLSSFDDSLLTSFCFDKYPPRFSNMDKNVVNKVSNLDDIFQDSPIVFINMGNGHSISLASYLVKNFKYAPIWMYVNKLMLNGTTPIEQVMASIKYHLTDFDIDYSNSKSFAFVMDLHRHTIHAYGDYTDNNHYFKRSDFPSLKEVESTNKSILWIQESFKTSEEAVEISPSEIHEYFLNLKNNDGMHDGFSESLISYAEKGINVYLVEINPK